MRSRKMRFGHCTQAIYNTYVPLTAVMVSASSVTKMRSRGLAHRTYILLDYTSHRRDGNRCTDIRKIVYKNYKEPAKIDYNNDSYNNQNLKKKVCTKLYNV